MNENNIVAALNAYDGSQPSLENTVRVLSDEIGPDWMNQVFQQLGGLSPELKEKLNHAFNYYASLTAWQEAQAYLNQQEPLEMSIMNERLPVLKHWLDFFGQPGQELYQNLEDRFNQQSSLEDTAENPETEENTQTESPDPFLDQEPVLAEEAPDVSEVSAPQQLSTESQEFMEENLPPENKTDAVEGVFTDESVKSFVQEDESEDKQEKVDSVLNDDSAEGFAVHKAENEVALLHDLQAWLAARCLQLGDIENFAYPYYGLVVDLMRQVVKDIQAVLDIENKDIIEKYYPDSLETLTRQKQAIEADIQTAVENCESDTTALIEEGMDLNKVKKALGDLDTSTEKEYLGPAPDGFELLEDEKPIDEAAVKEQYEQLEETAQKNVQQKDISVTDEKKASQNEQNSVQRKLSFSLKPKKG